MRELLDVFGRWDPALQAGFVAFALVTVAAALVAGLHLSAIAGAPAKEAPCA